MDADWCNLRRGQTSELRFAPNAPNYDFDWMGKHVFEAVEPSFDLNW